MRQKMLRFLVVMFSVGALFGFSGGGALAVTFDYALGPVTVQQTATSATYTYTLTLLPGSSTLSYVDFEIPADIVIPAGAFTAAGTPKFEVKANSQGLAGEVYDLGVGDYGTKFGVGDPRYRVLKANVPNPTATLTLELTVRGQTLAPTKMFSTDTPGAVLIKAGNGSNTRTYVTVTPAIVDKPLEAPPTIANVSVFPNPVTPPECTTVSWELSAGATVSIAPPDFVEELTASFARICVPDAGTYTYQITATGSGATATSTTVSVVVSVNTPPLIETTCKQIRKNGGNSNTCIKLCLMTVNGEQQDIASADWFDNPDCEGTGIPLTIFGKGSDEYTLVCTPCDANVPSNHPQACTTNTMESGQTPFYLEHGSSGNRSKNCDIFNFEKQDQGFAAALGKDPWIVVNGRQVWSAK